MISFNSFRQFIIINSFNIFVGLILNYFITNVLMIFLGNVLKNIILYLFLDFNYQFKPFISKRKFITKNRKTELFQNILLVSFTDSMTFWIIGPFLKESKSFLQELGFFIINSFIFEIIFDFFHYWFHRLLHHKLIYKFFHKKHHEHPYTTLETTFHQDFFDLLLTNVLPIVFAFFLYPVSKKTFTIIMVYKTLAELSGHCGKIIKAGSFCQFIWLPKLLNIDLRIEDHDYHHSKNNGNYSKRFKLWDVLFGTYKNYNTN